MFYIVPTKRGMGLEIWGTLFWCRSPAAPDQIHKEPGQ